jgi:hypothetical protein
VRIIAPDDTVYLDLGPVFSEWEADVGRTYAFAQHAAADAGWLFGGVIAGHIVGEFPHAQRVPGDKDLHRIAPANPRRMRDPDGNGDERHWILEIHLIDETRTFGGFYERLL